MLTKIAQLFSLKCRHRNTSQPFAAAAAARSAPGSSWDSVGTGARHYVVCLDCGRKFDYDWQQMRIIRTA
jgi:hypothetical protein